MFRSFLLLGMMIAAVGAVLIASTAWVAAKDDAAQAKDVVSAERQRTPEQAAVEAELLHDLMHDTLQLVHHRYYKEDEGLELPAATLREIFESNAKKHQVRLRWLVVEGQAMNTDHVARDDFERAAVQALRNGADKFEAIENGVYRRAGPITLSNVCLKCHVPDRRNTKDRIAGLLISIPVKK